MNTQPWPATALPRDPLIIAGKSYRSRLLTGTGKFKDLDETRRATEAAGAEIVTVAIRRSNIGQDTNQPNLLDVLPPDRYTILPNTAGCYTADDAVRTCRLARELLDGHTLVKLEVLGDQKTLFPDVVQTLQAAETLVADGFQVMVYTSDDPILARRLEEIGCVAVMPLAAPIGSGLGIQNRWNILEIVENAKVPVLVDAGVGTASDAAIAMELGCDGVLMNTAIAGAKRSGADGQRDAQGGRSRPRGISGRAHSAQALCVGIESRSTARSVDRNPLTTQGIPESDLSAGTMPTRAPIASIRSFVLRQGRFTPAQQRAFAEHWPRYGLDPPRRRSPTGRGVFGRNAPLVLEIGFGNGEQLLWSAMHEPDRNFIGIEVHRPGVGRLMNALAAHNVEQCALV